MRSIRHVFLVLAFSLLPSLGRENLTVQQASAGANWSQLSAFLEHAWARHGDLGERAAEFLVAHMPEKDLRELKAEFLNENLDLALKARETFPWCRKLPEEQFFNDVLPYACLNEPRDPWRAEFFERASRVVAEAKTATEAAQALNRDLFKLINVHYDTKRKRPNQSPKESIEQGCATCSGLAVILADACRAVGVPARVAGTPLWTNKRGNHTWTEVWDGRWFFTGADEFDANGLDRGWFVGDASKALADDPKHAIYASSWKRTGLHFPLVWARRDHSVAAENVTARYIAAGQTGKPAKNVFVRVKAAAGGERIVVKAELLDGEGKALAAEDTKAGQADLNDMAGFVCESGRAYGLRLSQGTTAKRLAILGPSEPMTLDVDWSQTPDEAAASADQLEALRAWLSVPEAIRPDHWPKEWDAGKLTADGAKQATARLWEERKKRLQTEREAEMSAKAIVLGEHTLRFLERQFGEAPEGLRSLWISMHGGGNAPAQVNDRQWENQIKLYEPKEGFYVAPRAPTNTWNLWHEAHIDSLFERLIENYVALRGVDPDRVYLLGYSAGGDGVYQLAPRFADRLAAASMMAGHPNDASPLGLRNLPFAIFMGGKDAAYKRNEVAAEWGKKLAELRKADPQGYPHRVTIYEGLGHWMEKRDAEAVPWMAEHKRNLWPKKVVWRQSSRPHERFYWLATPKDLAAKGQQVTAEVDGQNVRVTTEGVSKVELRLSDQLLNLDQPIQVSLNGKPAFEGKVQRSVRALMATLAERAGGRGAASVALSVGE